MKIRVALWLMPLILALGFGVTCDGDEEGDGAPPDDPSGLVATAVSAHKIDLQWDDNSDNETGFIIERKAFATGSFAPITTVNTGTTNYQDVGLSASTIYYYRIVAAGDSGHSEYSNEDKARTYDLITVLRSTADAVSGNEPSLVWNGTEYAQTWDDDLYGEWELFFTRLSETGERIGGEIRLGSAGHSSSLVWTGSEYGVSWESDRDYDPFHGNLEIYFARISAEGLKVGGDVRITFDNAMSFRSSMVWTGSEYGLIWLDYRTGDAEVYFTRISSDGVEIDDEVQLTFNHCDPFTSTDLTWTGSEFAFSWTAGTPIYNIYFSRISPSGAKIGGDIAIPSTPGYNQFPSLAWTGSEYGLAWGQYSFDGLMNEIFFTRVSTGGAPIAPETRITFDKHGRWCPSLVWNGSEFGVSWYDYRRYYASDIYFARISTTGIKLGPEIVISLGNESGAPSMVWTNSDYGIAWQDKPHHRRQIFFGRLSGIVP